MSELRKAFYVFDMAMFGFLLFAINHTMLFENWIVSALLDMALLLRVIVPLLLYKKERLAIIPLLTFALLFGVCIYMGAFHDLVINMAPFPGTLMRSIIYWVWLIPVAIYIVQYAAEQTKDDGYPWYYLIGGIVFKESIGKLLLSIALPLFVAFLIGYEMQEYLSFYALMSLPVVGYYFWNRHLGRTPYWIEYAIMLIGLYVFDKAQYKVDGERVAYLITSACIIFAVCGWMLYKSRQLVVSTLTFLMAAFLLPTMSLGYNVYQSIEGARSTKYEHVGLSNSRGYMYIRRDVIKDGKGNWSMGVRNRYHTTIPCEYKFIIPTKHYSPFAICINENRDSVIRSVEYGYVLE
ncbi:MAG: hypothetical protein IJ190_05450 [Prevotella sp.]|nr:hypothetical protein [Prevotella sp.]